MLYIYFTLLIVQYIISINGKWVVDVDSSIVDEIQQNPSIGYLIKFHAPWCGHCRHFEPVYEEIAEEVSELSSTDDELKDIRIVRLDATVYSDVATYYDIRGYPTVKFIRGSQIIPYESERTKSGVIDFLKRVNGPPLKWILSIDKFNEIRNEREVFFLLVTTSTFEDDPLTKEYNNTVTRYLSQAYFYATNSSIIQETYFSNYKFDDESQIFAVKKDEFYLYESDKYNSSIEEFIFKEKIATFPQVAAGNMYDLVLTKKIIVIYGFDEQSNQKNHEIKSRIHNYIINHGSTIRHTFQFAWSHDLDLLSNIAVWTVEGPLLFLYDSVQRKYGMHSLSSTDGKTIDIESALDYVMSNYTQIIHQTGNTFAKRLFRPFWELSRTLMVMFTDSPFISMLIIGLPASVLSIVCYCLCCLPNEAMNDPEYSNETMEQNEVDDVSSSEITTDDTPKTINDKKED